MTKNIGVIDRIIRLIIGLVLLYFGYIYGVSDTIGIVFIVLGVILVVEFLVGICLIYKILGINTVKSKMAQGQPQQPQQSQQSQQQQPPQNS